VSPRSTAQRIADTRARLGSEIDTWVSTVDPDGEPRLAVLSLLWHDETVLLATSTTGATGRNLGARPTVRLAVGATRDVVLIDGAVEVLETGAVDQASGDAFAAHAGFDPRPIAGFAFFRVTPRSIQAWREEDELAGRWIMRDGRWLDGTTLGG
jgi:hypothetical protein